MRRDRPHTGAAAIAITVVVGAALLVQAGPAFAVVSDVRGTGFGAFAHITILGGLNRSGPNPVATLPAGGSASAVTASAPSTLVQFGPATIFTSGAASVSTQGTPGGGSVSTSTSVSSITNASGEVFTATSVSSSCAASEGARSGTTTISGGVLQTDSGDNDPTNAIPDHPAVNVTVPTNPAPNTAINGHIHVNNATDTFTYVFNEQVVGADGSMTVSAAHLKLIGPNAVGDLYVGQSVCAAAGGTTPMFTSLPPSRILDTRFGIGLPVGTIGPPAADPQVPVTGVGGVPASGVGAVVLNVTVTEPTQASFLTVYPTGQALPNASNLNFVANQTVPNLVVAKVGSGGTVSVNLHDGATHLIFDVVGWFASSAINFTSLPPSRILDTRFGIGVPPGGQITPATDIQVPVTGVGGVPASGVGAVILNVTVTQPTEASFLTAYPTGQALPNASNLNFVANQTVPNLVMAKVGTGGTVSVNLHNGATHLIFDVVGWFGSGASSFTSLAPSRVLDTRFGIGLPVGKIGPPAADAQVQVTGVGGVPASGVGAVVLNVMVTEPTQDSFLTVYPTGQALPNASNLNFVANQTVPNLVVAKVGTGGKVSVNLHNGATHLIFDVVGWFGT